MWLASYTWGRSVYKRHSECRIQSLTADRSPTICFSLRKAWSVARKAQVGEINCFRVGWIVIFVLFLFDLNFDPHWSCMRRFNRYLVEFPRTQLLSGSIRPGSGWWNIPIHPKWIYVHSCSQVTMCSRVPNLPKVLASICTAAKKHSDIIAVLQHISQNNLQTAKPQIRLTSLLPHTPVSVSSYNYWCKYSRSINYNIV